jgi:hypothetical protein
MRVAVITLSVLVCFGCVELRADDDPSVLFSDDFSTLDPAWGDAEDVMHVEGGKFVLQPKPNTAHSSLYGGSTFNDVDIRVKISQADGKLADGSAGIVFWGSDNDNMYTAEFSADGNVTVQRFEGRKWLSPSPWKANDAVKKDLNQVNELRVVTKGRSATFYVNDKQVAAIKGFPPTGGSQIGLTAESGDKVYTWKFSDLVVRKPQ